MIKTFSIEEANRALVFVAPIVREIRELWSEISSRQAGLACPSEEWVQSKKQRVEYCVRELLSVGCSIKELPKGRLDFPSFYKNIPVILCWQEGDGIILFWHEVHNTNGERLPITEDFVLWNSPKPQEVLGFA